MPRPIYLIKTTYIITSLQFTFNFKGVYTQTCVPMYLTYTYQALEQNLPKKLKKTIIHFFHQTKFQFIKQPNEGFAVLAESILHTKNKKQKQKNTKNLIQIPTACQNLFPWEILLGSPIYLVFKNILSIMKLTEKT